MLYHFSLVGRGIGENPGGPGGQKMHPSRIVWESLNSGVVA